VVSNGQRRRSTILIRISGCWHRRRSLILFVSVSSLSQSTTEHSIGARVKEVVWLVQQVSHSRFPKFVLVSSCPLHVSGALSVHIDRIRIESAPCLRIHSPHCFIPCLLSGLSKPFHLSDSGSLSARSISYRNPVPGSLSTSPLFPFSG
jgi:hypothetical protein